MNLSHTAHRPIWSLRRVVMLAALAAALILGSLWVVDQTTPDASAQPASISLDQDGRCVSHDPCPAIVDGALTPAVSVPHVLSYDPTSKNPLDAFDEAHPCIHAAESLPVAERLHVDLCVWRT